MSPYSTWLETLSLLGFKKEDSERKKTRVLERERERDGEVQRGAEEEEGAESMEEVKDSRRFKRKAPPEAAASLYLRQAQAEAREKWRRDQKEAVEKGLITMEDVEMAAADVDDNEESEGSKKGSKKFHMKKSVKVKQGKHKGKKKGESSEPASAAAQASVDVMVE